MLYKRFLFTRQANAEALLLEKEDMHYGKKDTEDKNSPKLAKPAKTTKKVTQVLTCPECNKKMMKKGIRIRKFELVAK